MYYDVVNIRTGSHVMLMGRLPFRYAVSRQYPERQYLPASLVNDQAAMRQLRVYLSKSASAHSLVHMSDRDLLKRINNEIESRRIALISLPDIAVTQGHSRVSPGLSPPTAVSPLDQASAQAVTQWTPERRVSEVIRRAATKVPEGSRQALLSLLSKDNIALIVGTFAFVGVANLTPYGWAADLLILAVAYWYCGIAAIGVLQDLTQCISKTKSAKSSDDLDGASDALARAIIALGALGLIAVLHKIGQAKKGAVAAARPLSVVEQRMTIARNFFLESGINEDKIEEYMQGIDFSHHVEVVPVEAGIRLYRLEVADVGQQGSWYAETSTTTADQRGVAPFGEYGIERDAQGNAFLEPREQDYFKGAMPARVHPELKQKADVEYVVNGTTRMLRSTAAQITDVFSAPIRGASVRSREGGAIQYFSRDKLNIR